MGGQQLPAIKDQHVMKCHTVPRTWSVKRRLMCQWWSSRLWHCVVNLHPEDGGITTKKTTDRVNVFITVYRLTYIMWRLITWIVKSLWDKLITPTLLQILQSTLSDALYGKFYNLVGVRQCKAMCGTRTKTSQTVTKEQKAEASSLHLWCSSILPNLTRCLCWGLCDCWWGDAPEFKKHSDKYTHNSTPQLLTMPDKYACIQKRNMLICYSSNLVFSKLDLCTDNHLEKSEHPNSHLKLYIYFWQWLPYASPFMFSEAQHERISTVFTRI